MTHHQQYPHQPPHYQPPHPPPAAKRRIRPHYVIAAVGAAVLLVGVVAANVDPGSQLCHDLRAGVVPFVALAQNRTPAENADPPGAMRNDIEEIRTYCPDQAGAWTTLFDPQPLYAGGQATTEPAVPRTYELKVTGDASRATINYGVSGSNGSADSARVPWSKTMTGDSTYDSPMVSAYTDLGDQGVLACEIVDVETGQVLASDQARSEGGEYGSASVNCFAD